MAPSRKRNVWITVFLLTTCGVIGEELWAAFDRSPDTTPWTDLLATYVSPWVTFSAIGVVVIWLPWHFILAYRAKRLERELRAQGVPIPIAPEPLDVSIALIKPDDGARP
jgi:hypothetical protein